jgi:type III secretory pathway component EscU
MDKQIDIYIALATSIFGAVLGVLLGKILSTESQKKGNATNITQSVSINTINHNSSVLQKDAQQETEIFMLLGGLFVFVGLTLYIFFRTIILTSLLYGEIFLLSVWIGGVLRSIASGRFKGFTWSIYLLYVAAFMVMYFIAIVLAFNPIYAPDNFQYAEQIINHNGWSGLKQIFSIDNLLWGIIHLIGIFVLIFTFWHITMSLLHILVAGNGISSGKSDSWIVRKTAKYCTPWTNIILFTLFIILGGTMVSGLFLHWMQYEIPAFTKEILNIVLYGRG